MASPVIDVAFAQWEPPIEDVEYALFSVFNYVEHYEEPMFEAREIAMDDMKDHFYYEEDPDGVPWAPLSPAYADQKEQQGYDPMKILWRTGDLERAATSEEAWEIVGGDLFFNAHFLPEYGVSHQVGRDTGGKRGGKMPARPFIGLSEEAEGKIIVLFETWYDGTVAIWEKGV